MRKADNLQPSCAVVTKSGNLNFLEPSGILQACNGTALPFTDIPDGNLENFLTTKQNLAGFLQLTSADPLVFCVNLNVREL